MTPPSDAPAAIAFDDVYDLVEEVLRTGLMLADLLDDLLDALPADAYPGERPGEVLLEMVAGSVHPAAAALGTDAVRQATALVGALGDRVIADLKAAAELQRGRR
jgi:hypothetical protein